MPEDDPTDFPPFPVGGGRMGAMMRAHDWASSPLGHPDAWPACLRATVNLLLGSRFPMFVAFGPELGFLYNDAYAGILGGKHPAALGRRFRDIWSEIWSDIAPLIEGALRGEATWSENMPLTMNRRGYDEQTWFTFSYSPVRDEAGRVAGMFCACTETTAQIRAETGLRDAEARLRAVTDHLPGGYVYQLVTPLDGSTRRFLTVSQGFERMTGVPAATVLADPAAAYDLILPEHRSRIAEAEAVAIRDLSPFDVEVPMRRPDGRLVWTRIISAPRLVDGEVIWDGLHIDDSARRRAEEQLRESETRLRLATEAAEVGLWDLDVATDTLFWPARVKAMFGISADVPVTMADYYAGLHPDDRAATVAAFAAALDPDRRALYDVEYRTVGREDGLIRWVAAKGRGVFEDGRCRRVLGTAVDVTARKHAEQALRDSEEQFRVLSQVLPNFAWATDPAGSAYWYNERVYAYAGTRPGELDAQGWQEIIHPDDRGRVTEEWTAAVAGRSGYQTEYRLRRSDGAYRWFLARAQPVLCGRRHRRPLGRHQHGHRRPEARHGGARPVQRDPGAPRGRANGRARPGLAQLARPARRRRGRRRLPRRQPGLGNHPRARPRGGGRPSLQRVHLARPTGARRRTPSSGRRPPTTSRISRTATATRTAPGAGCPGGPPSRANSSTPTDATSPPRRPRPRRCARSRRRCASRRSWRRSGS